MSGIRCMDVGLDGHEAGMIEGREREGRGRERARGKWDLIS